MSKFSDTLNPEDVKLLLMARDQILAAPPKRFLMDRWATAAPPVDGECQTAYCIGGHMAILNEPKIARLEYSNRIIFSWVRQRFYGDRPSSSEWSQLFNIDLWPKEFRDREYSEDDDSNLFTATPEQAAARIDYWLETGE